MQKRLITPYPGAPDLSVYEEEDLHSAFSPKADAQLDRSSRYAGTNDKYLDLIAVQCVIFSY